jgi:hypothetical protein
MNNPMASFPPRRGATSPLVLIYASKRNVEVD